MSQRNPLHPGPPVELYTEAHIQEYLTRLGRMAAKRLNRPALHLMRRSIDQIVLPGKGIETVVDAPRMLKQPLSRVRSLLLDESTLGAIARALLPLDFIVPRVKREKIMQAVAANITAHGRTMAERWSGSPVTNVADALADLTILTLAPVRSAITRFVRSRLTFDWAIATDFNIVRAGDRPNDAFVYTVYPYDAGEGLELIIRNAQSHLARDYKHSSRGASADMLKYLASRHHFTFAFVPTRKRRLFSSVAEARNAIDSTIAMIANYNDVERFGLVLAEWKTLRQSAEANNFNYRLLENMMLSSIFAATIATLLAAEGRARTIMWVPDRDSMTTAYGGLIQYEMFSSNAAAFAMRHRLPPSQLAYGVEGTSRPGGSPWYDPIIRVPDFIAGFLSGWDAITHRLGDSKANAPDIPISNELRDKAILHQVLCDNPNLAIVLYQAMEVGDIRPTLLHLSLSPIMTSKLFTNAY